MSRQLIEWKPLTISFVTLFEVLISYWNLLLWFSSATRYAIELYIYTVNVPVNNGLCSTYLLMVHVDWALILLCDYGAVKRKLFRHSLRVILSALHMIPYINSSPQLNKSTMYLANFMFQSSRSLLLVGWQIIIGSSSHETQYSYIEVIEKCFLIWSIMLWAFELCH